MSIETKLDIGDVIFSIKCTKYIGKETCDVCDCKGYIEVKNWDKQGCPKCYGKGYIETYGEKEWRINQTFTGLNVGSISAEKSLKRRDGKNTKTEVRYYPVGLGNWINEANIFKTEQEALDECAERNSKCEAIK